MKRAEHHHHHNHDHPSLPPARSHAKLHKMTPGLSVGGDAYAGSHSSASSGLDTSSASLLSPTSSDDDYSAFMSDVLVVGAGPSGLMLA